VGANILNATSPSKKDRDLHSIYNTFGPNLNPRIENARKELGEGCETATSEDDRVGVIIAPGGSHPEASVFSLKTQRVKEIMVSKGLKKKEAYAPGHPGKKMVAGIRDTKKDVGSKQRLTVAQWGTGVSERKSSMPILKKTRSGEEFVRYGGYFAVRNTRKGLVFRWVGCDRLAFFA